MILQGWRNCRLWNHGEFSAARNACCTTLNGPLQVHAARALHQHHVAGAQRLPEPAPAASAWEETVPQRPRCRPPWPGARRCPARRPPGQARLGSARPQPRASRAMLAHLQHLAGHQDAPLPQDARQACGSSTAAPRDSSCSCRSESLRRRSRELPALVARRQRGQRGHRCIQIDARFQRHRQPGHRIGRVVHAQQLQCQRPSRSPARNVRCSPEASSFASRTTADRRTGLRRSKRRALKPRPNCETYSSSQLRNATPFAGSASTSSNLARAIPPAHRQSSQCAPCPRWSPRPSPARRCAPAQRSHRRGSCPSRSRQFRAPASRRSNCSGRPKPLFRLPRDFSTLNFAPSAAATASLVVVFPAEPVMATTRLPQRLRTCAASACKAISGSSAISSGARQHRIRQRGYARPRNNSRNRAAIKRRRQQSHAHQAARRAPQKTARPHHRPRVDGVAAHRKRARVEPRLPALPAPRPRRLPPLPRVSFIALSP
jgi:hypothetical protein